MQIMIFFVLISVIFLGGCHSDEESSSIEMESSLEMQKTMLFVEGSQDTVVLGTNKKYSKIDETPEMKVLLDYDFWVDSHKVTCGEFKSVFEDRIGCESDSLPIVNVTFFDAVLFANEKSKNENLDTVYEYSNVEFDRDGRCVNLVGISFNLNKKGYRLPTEAEWVKLASKTNGCLDCFAKEKEFVNDYKGIFRNDVVTNFAGAFSPNDTDERIIKGGDESDSLNLYSRGGTYPVSPSTYDSHVGFRLAIGAIPNPTFFDHEGKEVKSSVKVVSSALELWDYAKTSKIKLVFKDEVTGSLNYIDYASGSDIIEIADSESAYHPDISPDGSKVAYCTGVEGIDRKSRVYVRNLDEEGSGLVELDVENAAIPRWNVLENGDTVITYVTGAGNNSSESTFKSMSTWQVPFAKGKFGKPNKLFDGAYHGGVSEDGRLAVTGSKLLRTRVDGKEGVWYNGEQACNVSLARDSSKRTSFLDFQGATGKKFAGEKYRVHEILFVADSVGNLIQSVKAPSGYVFDHSEWTTGFVNENIVTTLTNADGAHTKIVLVHLTDSSITYLVEGDELWHPSLWTAKKIRVRSSSSAVSSSSEPVGSSSEIASSSSEPVSSSSEIVSSSNAPVSSSSELVGSSSEIASGSSEPVSSSSEIVGSSSESVSSSSEIATNPKSSSSLEGLIYNVVLDEDSAGFYVKNEEFQEAHWSYKMELVWTYWDKADVVIFGSSRSEHGVIPALFSDQFFAIDLASAHGSTHSSYYMAVNYVFPHFKKLKYVIFEISFDRIWMTKQNSFFYLKSPEIKGYAYDANHDFWKTGIPEGLKELTQEVPKVSSYAVILDERGYMPLSGCGSWRSSVRAEGDTAVLDTGRARLEETFGYLTEIIELAAKNDVKVVAVEFPQNPNYKNVNAYGKYGVRNSDAPEILGRIEALTEKYSNFIFFDQNKMGNHDYESGMNYDDDHLCRAGAERMTLRLDSLLKTLD